MATLYRKYRPQTFDQIVGQDHVVITLRKALELDRVAHAYLFAGARGVGKTTLARLLAKAVNCLDKKNRPCGKCKNCLEVAAGKFVDLIEIDAASNRGIDEMRDLRDRVQFAPSVGKKRVYIIDEVHMLTREAFNALLKTLEEPPAHTLFIFATTEVHKVPATILSRCQRFDFRLGTQEAVKKNINQLAKKEKLKLTDEVADLIVRCAGGSYRDAQSILDQLSSHLIGGELNVGEAAKLLNLSTYEQVDQFIKKLKEGDLGKVISFIGDLDDKNVDFGNLTDSIIVELRRMMIASIMGGEDISWAKEALEEISKAKRIAQSTPVESLALELAAVEICGGENANCQLTADSGEEKRQRESNKKQQPDPKPQPPAKTPKNKFSGVELSADQRQAIQEAVRQKNMALGALLALANWKIDQGQLCFAVEYPIYKDKILSQKSLEIIQSCATEVLGGKVSVSCEVEKPEDMGKEIEAIFGESA
jgi:DNA polymerase III subunit gamma/tau